MISKSLLVPARAEIGCLRPLDFIDIYKVTGKLPLVQFAPYREVLAHVHSYPPNVSVHVFPDVQLTLTF